MLYKCENLTGMIVTMSSKEQMLEFLQDRERSVRSKIRKGENYKPLTDELRLILDLRENLSPTPQKTLF